jgi:hypothetical protein
MKKREMITLSDSGVIGNYLLKEWDNSTIDKIESLYTVYLNWQDRVISSTKFATGNEDSCRFNIADIVKTAIKLNAYGVILAHNHPSGSTKPSEQDISATEEVYVKCAFMGIRLVDHMIISPTGNYTSMYESGYFKECERGYNRLVNLRKPGTYEHTALAVLDKSFKKLVESGGAEWVHNQMIKDIEKVFTKYFDPII